MAAEPVPLPAQDAAVSATTALDPHAEQARLAEVVVRCAAALVACDDDGQALIERKCAVLTTLVPRIALAWTWFGPADTDTVQPQAMAGRAVAYAQGLVIQRTRLTAPGPVFRTLSGERLQPAEIDDHSPFPPWRQAAREHGIRSVLSLPLSPRMGGQRGVFVLYADQPGYFQQVGVGLFEAVGQLFSAILQRAGQQAELTQAAYRDSLTGLLNRGALQRMQASLWRDTPLGVSVALVMVDLDHFKRINDSHGHLAGDAALAHTAQRLQAALRRGDTVVRWGGEEFVVVLTHLSLDEAERVAENLRASIEAVPAVLGPGVHHPMTASIGVTELGVRESLDTALARADAALYQAKQQGRNRVVVVHGADAQEHSTVAVEPRGRRAG